MATSHALQQLFSLMVALLLIGGGALAADMPMPVNEEVLGLVVFKSALSDPSGALATWTESDATPCGWRGVECDPATSRVLRLSLDGLALSGPMPRGLDRLTALQELTLARNNISGPLPPGLSLLASLRSLDLSYNAFSGPVPDDVALLASLRYLDLTGNAFSGPLPAAFPSSRLRTLDLSRNQFSGPVTDGISRLHNLKTLSLAGNRFFGAVPQDIGMCPHLSTLDLSSNAFGGHLPDSIAQLGSLVFLSASGNRLSSDVPAWLGKLAAVQHVDLSDNALTGSLPDSLGDLKALKYLSLSRNQLSGTVPPSLSGCTKLAELHLRGNGLSGSIPEALFDVGLETLDMSSNALSGALPSGSTRMAETLQWLDLSGNRLTGGIPTEMLLFLKLRYLNLSSNDLRTPLPPELGLLRNLTVLDLRSTGLYGAVPADLCQSGSSLAVLQLDGNSLAGPIPDTIGNCSSLYLLSLGHNGLTGPIPSGIAELKKLEILRLEYNNLSGEIPAQLGSVESLLAVNISHNRLVGRLPASGVFQSLDASALEGNLGICSPLVAEPCRMNVPKPLVLDPNQYPHGGSGDNNLETNGAGDRPRKRRVLSVSAMVAICAALAIALGVVVITLLNMSARRRAAAAGVPRSGEHNKELESVVTGIGGSSATTKSSSSTGGGKGKQLAAGKMVTFGPGSSLRSEDLVAGADALLSKATEIGRGAYGTVYRASVGEGRVVAIKKLSASVAASREDFDREARVLGKAKHPNLLALKGYYWTPQLQLLITDYAPHGSLEARLHHQVDDGRPPMTWEERFRVVSGTARGLAHLHQAFRPPLIHYDVKPSNIFLDERCNPVVGDFGLARLLPRPEQQRRHAVGGSGYVAPELACQSLRVNEKCDIYGLGVVILELVTGRRAVEYGDDDVVVLQDQVRVMLEHGNALECVDPAMGGDFPEEEVLPVLKLGMVCTSQIPSNRPSMAEVVQILQVIKAPVGGRMEAAAAANF
ncbi:unnamed protein product [Urochloa humidicola]